MSGSTVVCSCGWRGAHSEAITPIEGRNMRVEPGAAKPVGRCPACSRLVYFASDPRPRWVPPRVRVCWSRKSEPRPMKIVYRVFVAATLLALAYGMGTAKYRSHPWFIIAPLAVLGVIGGIRYGRDDRE